MAKPLRGDPVVGPRFRLTPWRERAKASREQSPDGKSSIADLRRALDDGAKQVRNSFIWFVTVSTYFAVLVGTTTHEQLFLGQSIKIPVVDVTLPIDAVYLVAPLVYFVIYVSFLVQADGLGQVLARYRAQLDTLPAERRQHEITVTTDLALVNLYLRTSNSRTVTFLTWSIFVIAFFATPLVITLLFQVNFLPYKHHWLTYYHMGLVTATTGLSLYFWFRFAPALKLQSRWKFVSNALLVGLPILGTLLALSSMLVFVPEQSWLERNTNVSSLGQLRTIVSRSLKLRGLAIGDASKVVTITKRDLSNADFSGARLTNVEFVNPILHGAQFQLSVMRTVRFICKEDIYEAIAEPDCSIDALDMSGALLHAVQMQNFSVGFLNLRSATVIRSRLIVDVSIAHLENSKVWASTFGHADSTSEKQDRTTAWAYVGEAMLRDTTLFAHTVSGINELQLAVNSTFTTDSASENTEALSAGRVFIGEILEAEDALNVKRRWNLAFEQHEAAALFATSRDGTQGAAPHAPAETLSGPPTSAPDFSAMTPDKWVETPSGPPTSAPPVVALVERIGRLGYSIGQGRRLEVDDITSVIQAANEACASARPGPVLTTGVSLFLRRAVSEQVRGRGLIQFTMVASMPTKRSGESDPAFEKRREAAHLRRQKLAKDRATEISQLNEIWDVLASSPCLCEKTSSKDLISTRRVAANLAAIKSGSAIAQDAPFCVATPVEP